MVQPKKCKSFFFPPLKDLDVGLGQGQRLRQNLDDVQILHLEPLAGTWMKLKFM